MKLTLHSLLACAGLTALGALGTAAHADQLDVRIADYDKAITSRLGQSAAHASCGPCDRDPDAHGPALYRDFMLKREEAQPARIDPKV